MYASLFAAFTLAAAPATTPFPAPQPPTLEHCRAAACSSLEDVRICKCGSEAEPAPDLLVVDGPGDRRAFWEAESFEGAVSDFLASSTDLDGDGKPELIVANRAAESKQPVGRTWEVSIVDGATGSVLHFRSEDFGPDAIGKGSVLVTEWEWLKGPAGSKEGDPAPTFVGREYTYKKGHLEPSKEPARRRKLTKEFETERQAALNPNDLTTATPRKWLASPATQKVAEGASPASHRSAVVRGVTRDETQLELHLERDDGQLETLSSDGEDGVLLRLADAKSHRLLPPGYVPADAESWLIGKKVTVAMSGDAAAGLLLVP